MIKNESFTEDSGMVLMYYISLYFPVAFRITIYFLLILSVFVCCIMGVFVKAEYDKA